MLVGTFALVALMLSAVGIYGVLSSMVTERTAEIGLRLALGGNPGAIRARVVGRGLLVAAVGLALGAAVAAAGTPLLTRLLFKVGPHDASTYVAQVAVLAAVCVVASWVPARRASRIDPMRALRGE
jgi:ABC-type antimicrobial peptide transport system permease subunit